MKKNLNNILDLQNRPYKNPPKSNPKDNQLI